MKFGACGLVLCLLTLAGTGAEVQAASEQTLSYQLYAGGIHALKAQIKLSEGDGRYKIDVTSGTTSGFKLVAPWSGSFVTAGWLEGGQRHPETYESISKTSKTKVKSIVYSHEGELVSYKQTENETDKTPNPLDRTLAPTGIVDVLTATMQIADRLNAGKGCAGSAVIFDGDRNFKLSFADVGTGQIEAGKHSFYSGPATACSFAMEPGEGRWKKKRKGWLMLQDQAKSLGTEPMVYFAKLDPTGSYVPVRVQIKTNYGTLLLHLSNAQTQSAAVTEPVKKAN